MFRFNRTVLMIVVSICSAVLLIGVGIFDSEHAFAFDAPPKDQGHVGPNLSPPPPSPPPEPCPLPGSPVHLRTGNYFISNKDFSIPGIGLPLELKRHYNSQSKIEGPFGYGWTIKYLMSWVEIKKGGETYIVIKKGNGINIQFKDNGDGTYEAPSGWQVSLTRDASNYYFINENGIKHTFNNNGYLTSIADMNDNNMTFGYDGAGKIITITDAIGRIVNISYGTNNKISSINDPVGRVYNYTYDSQVNLTGYTDPLGNVTTYNYDSNHNITSIIDADGNTASSMIYDSLDRLSSYTEKGKTWYIYYDPANNVTMERPPGVVGWQYFFNNTGQCIEQWAPDNKTIKNTYDSDLNLIEHKPLRGTTMYYTYDSDSNMLTKRDPNNNTTAYTYVAGTNWIETETDPLGHVSKYEYDSNGDKTKIIRDFGGPLQNEAVSVYDSYGQITSFTDSLGNTTSFTYDSSGNLINITDALSNVVTFTYDNRGNKLTTTDALGNITTYTYDLLDRVTSYTDALGNAATFTYDLSGKLLNVTDPAGNVTNNTYDSFNRLIQITDASGNTIQFGFDTHGKRNSITDANGNTTTYTFDSFNNIASETNALGKVTSYTYYARYLTGLTDANYKTTYFGRDSYNRVDRIYYPEPTSESFTYDADSNLISRTDRNGNTINYTYDSLHRMTVKTYPDDSQVTYSYDLLDRLTSAVSGSSNISITYDALSRIVQTVQDTKTISYEYDGNGNRTKLTYPDGSYITYTYNVLNQLDQIKNSSSQVIADYTYDNLGRRTQLDLINGTQTSYQYDNADKLTSLINRVTSTSDIISSFAYANDSVGNRTSMTTDSGTHSYTYDDIYQLMAVDYSAGYPFSDMAYNVDAVGNRTSTVNGGTINYTTNNMNQYTNVAGTAFTYDSNGNLINDGINTYTYDYENRLIQIVTASDTVTFTYDHYNKRISKTDSTGTTKYIYDDAHVIMETDGLGTSTATYVYGNKIDEILTMTRGGSTYYYHLDGLGNVKELTDLSGVIVEKYKYDVYGQPSIYNGSDNPLSESAIGNSYMFTGRRLDKESGLYYYRARYYNFVYGRFMTADPIGFDGGINFYTYVQNNPVNFVDPFGLFSCKGEWRINRMAWSAFWCTCYWRCQPCEGEVIHGNTITSTGKTFEDQYGRKTCTCPDPGPEEKCKCQ